MPSMSTTKGSAVGHLLGIAPMKLLGAHAPVPAKFMPMSHAYFMFVLFR